MHVLSCFSFPENRFSMHKRKEKEKTKRNVAMAEQTKDTLSIEEHEQTQVSFVK